jgi:hypothetical protein
MDFDGRPDDLARFQRRMLERFLSQPQAMSAEDTDYLLDKIDQLSVGDVTDVGGEIEEAYEIEAKAHAA